VRNIFSSLRVHIPSDYNTALQNFCWSLCMADQLLPLKLFDKVSHITQLGLFCKECQKLYQIYIVIPTHLDHIHFSSDIILSSWHLQYSQHSWGYVSMAAVQVLVSSALTVGAFSFLLTVTLDGVLFIYFFEKFL